MVIVGCDRRGTAYGTFALSEAMGVSPLYWWSDVPVKKQSALFLETLDYTSKAPSVKYRGIFINDEGWGITPWAAKTFDPELGDIGPNTYAKVCELILRMKGNMLEMLRMIGKMTGLQRRLYPMEIQSPPISSIRH